jgi:hypothetical protein
MEVHFLLQEQSGAMVLAGIFSPELETYVSQRRVLRFLTFLCHCTSFPARFLGFAGEPSTELSTYMRVETHLQNQVGNILSSIFITSKMY